MPFILRKTHPGGGYRTYVVVRPGFENHFDSGSVDYDHDTARATRFGTREEAGHWRAVLEGGPGTIEIEVANFR